MRETALDGVIGCAAGGCHRPERRTLSALVTAVKWLATALGEALLQRLVQRAGDWIVAVVESWLFGDLGTA